MIKATDILNKFSSASSSKVRRAGTMVPRKKVDDNGGKASILKEGTEIIAAFGRPPPNPQLLGPLVVLSVLESSNKKDNDDE